MREKWMTGFAVVAAVLLMGYGVLASQPDAGTKSEAPLKAADGSGNSAVAIRDVRVFDGEKVLPRATVVFADGEITAVGEEVEVPAGAVVVDGAGKTLLPGLIDSHTHSFGNALERALVFGVTTELDMFSVPSEAAARRREQEPGEGYAAYDRADLFSAGYLATAAGGHGTQYGLPVPTLAAPEEAQAWVAARAAEGSDYVKAVLENGSLFGRQVPTLDRATLAAVVAAADRHDLETVVHVSLLESARMALEVGAAGLVHVFSDQPADEAFVRQAVETGAFVVPTLTVIESTNGVASGAGLAKDPHLAPYLTAEEKVNLSQSFGVPGKPGDGQGLDAASRSVGRLAAAGVPILAGSDAPNPGTAHGASVHRELELLVAAGLTPVQALAAATSVPADAFSLKDRGRIAPGLVADLLLVEGDPTQDVTATRAIAGVWKRGRPLARQPAPQAPATADRPRPEPGLLSDFESDLTSRFGSGWTPSTDQMMGGTSQVELSRVEDGAGDSPGALRVHGEIAGTFAFPWAGAMFFGAERPMAPVDLSAAAALVFDVRGIGETPEGKFQLMIFSESLGRRPSVLTFDLTPDWRQLRVPLADFPGLDLGGFTGLLVSGGPATGPFAFEIDNVSLAAAP